MICALLQVVHVPLDGPEPMHIWKQLMGYKWNKEKFWENFFRVIGLDKIKIHCNM